MEVSTATVAGVRSTTITRLGSSTQAVLAGTCREVRTGTPNRLRVVSRESPPSGLSTGWADLPMALILDKAAQDAGLR